MRPWPNNLVRAVAGGPDGWRATIASVVGQIIEIDEAIQLGDVLAVSTDRSLTGQDGESYERSNPTDNNSIFPAKLAGRLFEADPKINHVYVMSNTLSIRRPGGWDEVSIDNARQVIANFFRFYTEEATSDSN